MFPRLRSFMTTLIHRQRFEASLDEEVRFHLDAHTDDLLRAGVPPREAARRARVLFGSIEAMKEGCRQERGVRITDELQRRLVRHPTRVRHYETAAANRQAALGKGGTGAG